MERDALLSLVRTAEVRQRADPAYRAELRDWGTDDFYRDDGVPLDAIGSRDENDAVPIRDFAPDRELPDRAVERFEDEPTIGTLALSDAQTPVLWLRAGQVLQRVLLEATRLGLATTLFTQPLEQPDLGRLLADPVGRTTVQAILRLGYAQFPSPPTPRRPPEEVILSAAWPRS
jgi:nitroreductase